MSFVDDFVQKVQNNEKSMSDFDKELEEFAQKNNYDKVLIGLYSNQIEKVVLQKIKKNKTG